MAVRTFGEYCGSRFRRASSKLCKQMINKKKNANPGARRELPGELRERRRFCRLPRPASGALRATEAHDFARFPCIGPGGACALKIGALA